MEEKTVKAIMTALKNGMKLEMYMLKDGTIKIRSVKYTELKI